MDDNSAFCAKYDKKCKFPLSTRNVGLAQVLLLTDWVRCCFNLAADPVTIIWIGRGAELVSIVILN